MITSLKNYSCPVGREPVEVHPDLRPMVAPGTAQSVTALVSMRLVNVSATATLWLSRTGPAGVNAPGSYPLSPGNREEATPPNILLEPLSVVADGDGGGLTAELRYLPRIFHTEAQRAAMVPADGVRS